MQHLEIAIYPDVVSDTLDDADGQQYATEPSNGSGGHVTGLLKLYTLLPPQPTHGDPRRLQRAPESAPTHCGRSMRAYLTLMNNTARNGSVCSLSV